MAQLSQYTSQASISLQEKRWIVAIGGTAEEEHTQTLIK